MGDIREVSKNQLLRGANRYKTICEVFRLIYDEVEHLEDNEKIVELLIDGIIMGAKMDKRLKYYQKKYNDKTGSSGSKLEYLLGVHETLKRRRKRKI